MTPDNQLQSERVLKLRLASRLVRRRPYLARHIPPE
jgi:hypothetical protein